MEALAREPAPARRHSDVGAWGWAFTLSNGIYGSLRMTRKLQDYGFAIVRWRNGTTDPRERPARAAEAAVQTHDRLQRDLALANLRKAPVMRLPSKGLIHHLECGSQ